MYLASAITTLLLSLVPLCGAAVFDNPKNLPRHKKYDYVVVGGGVAGSVIANRLTENRKVNVLVLEAGPSNKGVIETTIPFFFWIGIPATYSWNYTTVPQANLNDRSIAYPRGHILGGSSAINGMVYDRGTIDDYDRLANMTGDPGWSWDNLLPLFKKMENLGPPADHHNTTGQFNPAFHGFNGLLGDSLPGFSQAIDQRVLDTIGNNSIYMLTEDPNAGNELGFGWQVSTIHNGTRTTAATAYLADQFVARPNLDVLVNAFVTRVLASKGKTIDTVEFHQGNNNATNVHIKAAREVIMSAGTVNTPHILLNSGIGDNHTLSAQNISTFHHLPDVGKNMSDTAVMYISWQVDSNQTFDLFLNNMTARQEAIAEWNATRTGRMVNGGFNLAAMMRMNHSDPEVQSILQEFGDSTTGPTAGDFELLFIDGGVNGQNGKDGSVSGVNGSFFSMLLGATSPLSRGTISLNSSDPFGPPVFDPNYLSSQHDLLVLRQAFKTAIAFTSTPQWTSYLRTPINGLSEAIAALGTNNMTVVDELIRNNIQTGAHVVGTSSMSAVNADWGVVNPDLRVKGIKGLRIVDASVYPFIPGGATQIPTYVLAERAANVIKQSW